MEIENVHLHVKIDQVNDFHSIIKILIMDIMIREMYGMKHHHREVEIGFDDVLISDDMHHVIGQTM